MKSIATERLLLRKWDAQDCVDLFGYASNPEVGRNAGQSTLKTIAEAKHVLVQYIKADRSYAIVLQAENKVIGSIGYDVFIPDETYENTHHFSIGFSINPQYWGMGYATETVKYFIDYLFLEYKADVIWCSHFYFNERSKRVIEKCGFEYQFSRARRVKVLADTQVEELVYRLEKPLRRND